MHYREIAPPPHTATYVERLWLFTVGALRDDAPTHVIVPDGAVSVALIRPPTGQVFASFTGPAIRAHKADLLAGVTYAGVRLRPGAAGAVLHDDIAQYAGAFGQGVAPRPALLDAVQVEFPDVVALEEMPQALGRIAEMISAQAKPIDQPVFDLAAAIMESRGAAALGGLMAAGALSERQLRRRFKYQCGLSPKAFARLRRVREACIDLVKARMETIADTSAGRGFADQAHMSREFQDVFGGSVTMVEQYLKQIQHGDVG